MDFIPIAQPYVGDEEASAVYKQIKSGWISMGKRVEQFESMVQEYVGVKHAIALSDGTATLHAALLALGVKKGDEVIVPTLSYVSSANSVLYCNATPVFVEENEKTFNVDPEEIEKKITARTKVIMVVDLKGMPVDYDAINKLSAKYRIPVLADSAESFGARYKNEPVGKQSLVHSFSMFANKGITAGEGGIITTNDNEIAKTCRCIRNQGQEERYVHIMVGHNYRMTDISAAFAIEQLKRIEWFMREKSKIAEVYNNAFEGQALLHIPYVPQFVTRHSWYMYCLTVDKRVNRDKMAVLMREQGVDHRLSFPPIPLQPIYKKTFGYKHGDFPRSEMIFNRFIDIPIWVGMTKKQVKQVTQTVIKTAERSFD